MLMKYLKEYNEFESTDKWWEVDEVNESTLPLITNSDKEEVLELFHGYFDELDSEDYNLEDNRITISDSSSIIILVTFLQKDYIRFKELYSKFVNQLNNINMMVIGKPDLKFKDHLKYRIEVSHKYNMSNESIRSSDNSVSYLNDSDLLMIQDIFNGISDENDITMEYNGVKNIRPTKFNSQFAYIPIYYFSFIYSRKYRGNASIVSSTVYRYLTDDIKDYMISTIKQVLSVHGDIIATIPSDFSVVNYKDGYYKNTIGICLSKYSSCVENLIKYDKLDIIEL